MQKKELSQKVKKSSINQLNLPDLTVAKLKSKKIDTIGGLLKWADNNCQPAISGIGPTSVKKILSSIKKVKKLAGDSGHLNWDLFWGTSSEVTSTKKQSSLTSPDATAGKKKLGDTSQSDTEEGDNIKAARRNLALEIAQDERAIEEAAGALAEAEKYGKQYIQEAQSELEQARVASVANKLSIQNAIEILDEANEYGGECIAKAEEVIDQIKADKLEGLSKIKESFDKERKKVASIANKEAELLIREAELALIDAKNEAAMMIQTSTETFEEECEKVLATEDAKYEDLMVEAEEALVEEKGQVEEAVREAQEYLDQEKADGGALVEDAQKELDEETKNWEEAIEEAQTELEKEKKKRKKIVETAKKSIEEACENSSKSSLEVHVPELLIQISNPNLPKKIKLRYRKEIY